MRRLHRGPDAAQGAPAATGEWPALFAVADKTTMPGPMFHCTILFALRPGISLSRVRSAREALQALIETMPGVDHLSVTHNVADDRQGYNLALFSGFESKEACDIFRRHPEYRRVMDELAPLIERQVVAQGDGDVG